MQFHDKQIKYREEKPLTTSSQAKDALEDAGVSLSKSTIKRCLYESNHRVYNKVQTTGYT